MHRVQKIQRSLEERLAAASASAGASASASVAASASTTSTTTTPAAAHSEAEAQENPLDAIARIPGVQVFRPGDRLALSDAERQVPTFEHS